MLGTYSVNPKAVFVRHYVRTVRTPSASNKTWIKKLRNKQRNGTVFSVFP